MSVAGKKDVLAAGGRKMVSAGGIGDSPLDIKLKQIAAGEIEDPALSRNDVDFTVEKPKTPTYKFIPKNKHLLVRRDAAFEMSTVIVTETIEKEQNNTGVILESNSVDYTVGTRVIFGKYAGTEYRLNGEILLILRDEDIQGLLVLADQDVEIEETFEVPAGTPIAEA